MLCTSTLIWDVEQSLHVLGESHGNRGAGRVLTAATAALANLEIFRMSHDNQQTVTRFIAARWLKLVWVTVMLHDLLFHV